MEKKFHIRQRKAISSGGSILKFMPTDNADLVVSEINHFCLTGQVEEGIDNPKEWIRLYSSVMPEGHTGEDHIIVEDGKIYVEVLPNTNATSRTGIVHLTTMTSVGGVSVNSVQRIKLDITQLGQ